MDNWIFTALSEKDIDEVERIEKESFSEPWSRDAFEDATDNGFHRIYCLKLGTENADITVAYIGWAVVSGEAEITNVAVDAKFRGKGCGNELMKHAMAAFEKEGVEKIFLEVRAGNAPAIGLYEKFGFRGIGVRKNFYRFPTEDAIVMMKNMISE